MPVTYDVIEQGEVVLQYWSGTVSRDDLVAHENHHLADPRIMLGASVLVDARAALFGMTQEEVRDIIDSLYAAVPPPLNIKKCALLVNFETYPLAQAYEKGMEKYGISAIAFSFLNGACAWLGLDAERVTPQLEKLKGANRHPNQHLINHQCPLTLVVCPAPQH